MVKKVPVRIESDSQVYFGLVHTEGERKRTYSVLFNSWSLRELGIVMGLEGVTEDQVDWSVRDRAPTDFHLVKCPNYRERPAFLERLSPLSDVQLKELRGYVAEYQHL